MAAALLSAPATANAAAPARCSLIAQMSISTFLQMAQALASNEQDGVAASAAQLADLTTTYRNMFCDISSLGQAMDCVLENAGNNTPRKLAQSCLVSADLL